MSFFGGNRASLGSGRKNYFSDNKDDGPDPRFARMKDFSLLNQRCKDYSMMIIGGYPDTREGLELCQLAAHSIEKGRLSKDVFAEKGLKALQAAREGRPTLTL